MCHGVARNGQIVWWPDNVRIGHQRMLIDPNAKPLDEVWRFIRVISAIFLNKYKAWSNDKADMEELESMCYTAAYCRLLYMVRKGLYRKDLSFYLNVRSAVFSTCYNTYKVWLGDIRQRMNLVDATAIINEADHDGACIYDLRSQEQVPRLRTESEYHEYKRKAWRDHQRPLDRQIYLQKELDNAYDLYCEECVEFGLEPVSKVTFAIQNCSEDEKRILEAPVSRRVLSNREYCRRRAMLDPAWAEKRKEYNRRYYATHKKGKKKKKV